MVASWVWAVVWEDKVQRHLVFLFLFMALSSKVGVSILDRKIVTICFTGATGGVHPLSM